MAGCGECVISGTGFQALGSAWRALNAKPPFTGIHLVELDKASAAHLEDSMRPYPQVSVYQGDCNVVIPDEILPKVSRIAPTLAFLDPTGVQPTWKLVQQLARHRTGKRGEKMELLILFAFDMFINRWLTEESIWDRLDGFYGNRTWQEHLVESQRLNEGIDARRSRFMTLYVDQLKRDLGYKHVEPHGPLRKRHRVLYHMIFATDHDAGLKIMNDVWKVDRPIPGTLFYQRTFDLRPKPDE